jgi:Zn-dependent M28 family amino/carboxypeptidase
MMNKLGWITALLCLPALGWSQTMPPAVNPMLYDIATAASAKRIAADIEKLVNFGTRHTLSDTLSDTRGIGAARRWIKAEMERTSAACGGCLDVSYHRALAPAESNGRIPQDTWIVNVLALQKGTRYPNWYVLMTGDIDSRVSDPLDGVSDSPGANDNASGMAGVLEAARVLSRYQFPVSILYVGLSGEEQGLFGGKYLAERAKAEGWDIVGVLNNDMIGNIAGINGVIDNTTFRVFSEPTPPNDTEQQRIWRRFYGGEVDGPSRQLARYIDALTDTYFTNLDAKMIYRLDRFGRGGHHRPFNDEGFPGVRIMETHEHYDRQHQDLRTEDGVEYGDVISGVDFDYAAKLTGVNMVTLAALASAPAAPTGLMIGGAVMPSTTLQWDAAADEDIAAYKICWRETTSAQWEYFRYVPAGTTTVTLEGIVIDNYLFGVAAVGKNGSESVVAYPTTLIPRRR